MGRCLIAQGNVSNKTFRLGEGPARLIRGLRDKGLHDGHADPEDRRSIRLQLTPAGEAVHQALEVRGQGLAAAAVAGLNEEECRQLLALLGRIDSNLQPA